MSDDRFSRFSEIVPPEAQSKEIHIVGAGGIGSWLTLSLAKSGYRNLTVYDFDHIETPNVGVQLYGPHHRGLPKVWALRSIVESLTGTRIHPVIARVPDGAEIPPTADKVCLVTDSLASRRGVVDHLRQQGRTGTVLDIRTGARSGTIMLGHLNTPAYQATLEGDDVREACGERGWGVICQTAGSLGAGILTRAHCASNGVARALSFDFDDGLQAHVTVRDWG